ncbi:MAG: glucose-6-phosphate isomerase [Clostridia bacterium]|nr:glucose-6-phosphate isomerase [Clostridia bacterium]
MKLRLDYEFMTDGAVAGGVSPVDFTKDGEWISTAYDKVMQGRGKGMQAWSNLALSRKDLPEETYDFCDTIRHKAENLIVLGIGGSALGTLSVITALKHYHSFERKKQGNPAVYVEDNICPLRIKELFDIIDPQTSYFAVITKSGETPETLTQFFVIYDLMKRELGRDAKQHFFVITSLYKGALYEIAIREGFRIFDITEGVGGRFSVFDNAGLIPLSIAGVDVKNLLLGARTMSQNAFLPSVKQNIPLMTAYLKMREYRRGKNLSVIMPYCSRLKLITDFYCQLWAESLGKAVDLSGKEVFVGQTPVKALGTTDQHSQLQLYTQGPFDKVITFLAVDDLGSDVSIRASDEASYLDGYTVGKLLDTQRIATAFSLKQANRPNYTVYMPRVDEECVGELLTLMMYETAFSAAMLNVDCFNQPGVEAGKIATYALLGKSGYESQKDEIKSSHSEKFIINKKTTRSS